MKIINSLLTIVILSSSNLLSQSHIENIYNGEIIKFESKYLNEEKRIFVHLPNDYINKSYPTIYLVSSKPYDFKANIFRDQFIVVGIENENPKKHFIGEQNRDHYQCFLENELIPFIKKEYNASKIRYISGHSISGAFVIDIFNRYPNSFSFYIATSPAIHMLNLKVEISAFLEPTYLYFNIGTRENYEQLEKANNDLFKALDSLKIKNLKWKYEVLTDETHQTNEFTGFCRGYNYYKSFSIIPDSLLSINIHSIIDYVDDLNNQLGENIETGEYVFMPNLLINLNSKNYDNVLDGFKYIAESDTLFFINESRILIDIVDEIKNNGNYTTARKCYQIIYDKTKSKIVSERIIELDKIK